jgi:hypothetical protein
MVKKKLITPIGYIPFDEIEIEYLYYALKDVYGDEMVQLINRDESIAKPNLLPKLIT